MGLRHCMRVNRRSCESNATTASDSLAAPMAWSGKSATGNSGNGTATVRRSETTRAGFPHRVRPPHIGRSAFGTRDLVER